MGDNNEMKTGSSSSKPPTDGKGGPIIKESQESEEYQQDLQVVLGTAFGVIAVVGLIAVALLLYRVYKARQRALAYTANDADSVDRNISIDIDGKNQTVVLLLYSYDCPLHRRVVEALAGFLMEVCGVTVTLDLLEEAEIAERGIDDWLVDRLQEADHILVVCSLGARLRCSKKHVRFKHDGANNVLPDYFAVAVDYVAEKMRVERQKGLMTSDKFAVAFMTYSTRSDIPPQLEMAREFCLMRDLHKLHLHLNARGPEDATAEEKSEYCSQQQEGGGGGDGGHCEKFYHETETGALLKATIEQTAQFFKENPSWMADRLEHVTVPPPHYHHAAGGKSGKARKRRRNSLEQPLLVLTSAPWNGTTATPSRLGQGVAMPSSRKREHDNTAAYESNYSNKNNAPHHHHRLSATDFSNSRSLVVPTDEDLTGGGRRLNSADTFCSSPGGGICQNRQNSLPSSLASSCLSAAPPPSSHKRPLPQQLVSRSMDSVSMRSNCPREDHEGVPCLFCGSCHMDGRPECKRRQERPSSLLSQQLASSQDSLVLLNDNNTTVATTTNNNNSSVGSGSNDNLVESGLFGSRSNSHSQTVLHAEVHQEWGTPVRTLMRVDGKSNTFGGEMRNQTPEYEKTPPPPAVAFQSLPPHCPAPNSLTDWHGTTVGSTGDGNGQLRRWQSGIQDSSLNLSTPGRDGMFDHTRRLSQSSVYTDDSGSVSDTDSLERDLRSIQNISSFHDFVNSSSFVSRNTRLWQDANPKPSGVTPCPPLAPLSAPPPPPPTAAPPPSLGGLSKIFQKDFYKLSGADNMEMTQIRSTPIV